MTASSPARSPIASPLHGTVVSIEVAPGDLVTSGQTIAVLESMKMHHPVAAGFDARIVEVCAVVGELLKEGDLIATVAQVDATPRTSAASPPVDPNAIRSDLAGVLDRHLATLDQQRPDAVARRRKSGQRTARENIADLCDPGSFSEYGALALAAQRRRRSVDELIVTTPADGLVAGIGTINAARFPSADARALVMAYDYTVLAGTQGLMNHKKTDRMLELAQRLQLPIVWFVEGGGGRPGDTDAVAASWLDTPSFARFAALSGLVPRIGIASGYCFAGNAVFFGCCDITIATRNANIGMGGPAMIEGGGLGAFRPDQVGPIDVQSANGVVDLVCADEADATRRARQLLGCFQGTLTDWRCAEQQVLRSVVPQNRLLAYPIRTAIDALVDIDSLIELRRDYGRGMITAFARIEGRPIGLIANDPAHLGGAIDAPGAEKAARFMQLCDAFDVPIVTLCDTPGFMVGPESEKSAPVRRGSRMFVTAATLEVPIVTVILRKGYGLGAQAMAGGGFHSPVMTVAWPTAEFGAMGLEGAVRLAYRKELAAAPDDAQRQSMFDGFVNELYEAGKATSVASFLEIDAVIDPAQTRQWILRGLNAARPKAGNARRRRMIDTW